MSKLSLIYVCRTKRRNGERSVERPFLNLGVTDEALAVHEAVVAVRHHDRLARERLAVPLREAHNAGEGLAVEELELAVDARLDRLIELLRGHELLAFRKGHVPAPLIHEGVDGLVVGLRVRPHGLDGGVDGGPDEAVVLDAG